jgi:hypothetical protein
MSNTTSLADAEATPVARLIVKAALAIVHDDRGSRTADARATGRLRAFGEVAADVLDIAGTPDRFVLAITEAVRANPHPYTLTAARERAVTVREAWQRALVADVLDRLGNNDLPSSPKPGPAPGGSVGGSRRKGRLPVAHLEEAAGSSAEPGRGSAATWTASAHMRAGCGRSASST